MVAALFSRVTIITMGILYPAYSSFKAVRKRDHREYTKWMMYWIVFAFFQATETFTDIFISWVPLYYEVKLLFVLWLVLPITEGSKQVYRRLVHPFLVKYEGRIDDSISRAAQVGLDTFRKASQAGFNRAAQTMVQSAIMGQAALSERFMGHQYTEREQLQQQEHIGGVQREDASERTTSANTRQPLEQQYQQLGHRNYSNSDINNFEVIGEEELGVYSSGQRDAGFLWTEGHAKNSGSPHFEDNFYDSDVSLITLAKQQL